MILVNVSACAGGWNGDEQVDVVAIEGGLDGGLGLLCRRDSEGCRERLGLLRAVVDVELSAVIQGTESAVASPSAFEACFWSLACPCPAFFLLEFSRLCCPRFPLDPPRKLFLGGGLFKVSAKLIGSFNSSANDVSSMYAIPLSSSEYLSPLLPPVL